MCGIAGWFDLAAPRPADPALLKRMTDAIAHRGPDGEGFYAGHGVALGHRRLAIIDVAGGAQPMYGAGGKVALVFNGEIYNFPTLRRTLEARGHVFSTRSDTEVILHGWEEWGEACLDHLVGMFAIALYDERRQCLLLARDRLGEKPLYYAEPEDGRLLFGSELKALLAYPGFPRALDHQAVDRFFAFGYVPDPLTIFKGARRLEAGHALFVARGKPARPRAYWDVPFGARARASVETLAGELTHLLDQAIEGQLISDVPLGAFLSGGMDSSTVVALAARHVAGSVKTFSIGFDQPEYDESDYARAVAERYHTDHVTRRLDGHDPSALSRLPAIFDEPFGDSSALPTLRVAELARERVTVALSGDGGDELFAGYRRYRFHGAEERLRGLLPAGLRTPLFSALGQIYPRLDWAPRYLRARNTFEELSRDTDEGYFWNVSVMNDAARSALFTATMRRHLQGSRPVELIAEHRRRAATDDPVLAAQYVDLKTWLPGDILTKVDRTAMSCGLEVRVPMLDHRLVEWAMRLPPEARLAEGQGKRVLRQAALDLLPRAVFDRPKRGFSIPLADWLRGPMRALIDGAESGTGLALFDTDLFEPAAIRRLAERHRRGVEDNGRALWLVWMFEGFLQEYRPAA